MNKEYNLFDIVSKNKRLYKVIDFPRLENGKSIGKVCLRTLLQSEMTELDESVAEDIDNSFKKDSKIFSENSPIMLLRYEERLANIKANHYMAKFIVYPDNKDRMVFLDPGQVSQSLNITEASILMKEYWSLYDSIPNLLKLNADQFDTWIETLSNSADKDVASFLDHCYSMTHREFTTFLVKLCASLKSQNLLLTLRLENALTDANNPPSSPPIPTPVAP